jgi:hypothetical protein
MITLPTLNLNGTSKQELLAQIREAYDKTQAAIQALHQMFPHGRDYQIGPGEYQVARREHCERIEAFEKVLGDLTVLAEHVQP